MSNKITRIKGFNDLFPPESGVFARMEQAARRVFSLYGYQDLRIPILEKTELFCRTIGEETDVVQKEMYTFPDRKNRSLTMRPEATAGVVRAFIESGAWQPGHVYKYFAFGPMFRYERPQKGRMRQFHQIDAEIFGAEEPQADAELMLMLAAFLDEIGIEKVSFEVNSLGCAECRPVFKQALIDFLNNRRDGLCEDCQRRATTNPLRVLDCKVPGCKQAVENAPSIGGSLCPACREHFAAVTGLLDRAGLAFVLNDRLVRGLDYYQRTTFEVVSGDIGAQSSVAGGGRYDGLIKDLGGPAAPGVGFACGMERLALLMAGDQAPAPDFYLAVTDPRAVDTALVYAQALRAAGLAGETDFAAGSMKSRLRKADKSRARHCLILGGNEFDAGTVTVKDLGGGEQSTMPFDQYLSTITAETR